MQTSPRPAATWLRHDNRQLRKQLDLAAAVIQRITLENQRLREQLEAAAKVTTITHATMRSRHPPQA
jgi:hypothetical protein